MDPTQFIKDIAENISSLIPANLQTLRNDIEKNVRGILTNAFAKLELVSREEFDAQTKVLARTRQKLQALEVKLAELEQNMGNISHD